MALDHDPGLDFEKCSLNKMLRDSLQIDPEDGEEEGVCWHQINSEIIATRLLLEIQELVQEAIEERLQKDSEVSFEALVTA